ncbi:MAG: BON domain-containing protein [Betaproteobacteria bacterium]
MKNVFKGSWLLMGVLLLGLAACANTGQKSGAYVDDSWITTKVKSELIAENDTSARNISVKTVKGVVTLSGTADSMHESQKATEIARSVAGVTSVENDLLIQ